MPRVKKTSDDEVLDQALAILMKHGPHRVTLAAVGESVGLSASTLIQRFGSKRSLIDRALLRATANLQASLDAHKPSGDPRVDLVDLMVGQVCAFRTRAHVAGSLSLLIEDLTDESRRRGAQLHMAVLREAMGRQLEAMGSPTVEAHVAAFEASWHGLVIQWALLDTDVELDTWMRRGLEATLVLLMPG